MNPRFSIRFENFNVLNEATSCMSWHEIYVFASIIDIRISSLRFEIFTFDIFATFFTFICKNKGIPILRIINGTKVVPIVLYSIGSL